MYIYSTLNYFLFLNQKKKKNLKLFFNQGTSTNLNLRPWQKYYLSLYIMGSQSIYSLHFNNS